MTSLLMKIIACPLVLFVASWLFPNVEFGAFYQIVVVGLILAVVGVLMEYLLLREGTLWISTILDFVVSTLILYLIANMFAGAAVTFFGAVLTSILLGVVEYFAHLFLIKSGKTQKSPA